MNISDLKTIEGRIGYEFQNLALLRQAFTRKSYTQENGGQNNEILEFIGDKALDNIVIDVLIDYYGKVNNSCELESSLTEGQLTKLKTRLVDTTMLAHRIDILELSQYLRMGKGDIKEHVDEKDKVKEDLFEAIIGAVKMDSNNNYSSVYNTVVNMLDPYLYLEEGFDVENFDYVTPVWNWHKLCFGTYPLDFYTSEEDVYHYSMMLPVNNLCFAGKGKSKVLARYNAAKKCYSYLIENGYIRDDLDFLNIIGMVDRNNASIQLNVLFTKQLIEKPIEEYVEYPGCWSCIIKSGKHTGIGMGLNKPEAKKEAAYNLLMQLIGGFKR